MKAWAWCFSGCHASRGLHMWYVLLHVLFADVSVGVCCCCSRSWCIVGSGICRSLSCLSVPARNSAVIWVVLVWVDWQQDGIVVVIAQIAADVLSDCVSRSLHGACFSMPYCRRDQSVACFLSRLWVCPYVVAFSHICCTDVCNRYER